MIGGRGRFMRRGNEWQAWRWIRGKVRTFDLGEGYDGVGRLWVGELWSGRLTAPLNRRAGSR